MAKGFNAKLKSMNKVWESGKEGIPLIPAGQYMFQLVAAELAESQNGNLMIKRSHTVIEGEYEGDTIRDIMVLMDNEMSLGFLSQWIQDMGFEAPDSLETLPEVLAEMVETDVTYSGKLTYDGDYARVRPGVAISTEVEEEEDEEEIEDEEIEDEEVEEDEEIEDEEEEEDEDEDLQTLKDLAMNFGYDTEDASAEEIIATLKSDSEVTKESMTEDEVELLAKFGWDLNKKKAKITKEKKSIQKVSTKGKKTEPVKTKIKAKVKRK